LVRACYGVAAKCYEVCEFTDVLTQGIFLRVLSKELLRSHVFWKFPAFDGARGFITHFVQADETDTTTFISLSSIVIFSHLLMILPRYPFYPVIRPFLPCVLHSSPVSFSFYVTVPMTCVEVYKLLKSSLHSFLPIPYCSHNLSILKHFQSKFFLSQVSQSYKSAILAILV
jgi:hypothetical protein